MRLYVLCFALWSHLAYGQSTPCSCPKDGVAGTYKEECLGDVSVVSCLSGGQITVADAEAPGGSVTFDHATCLPDGQWVGTSCSGPVYALSAAAPFLDCPEISTTEIPEETTTESTTTTVPTTTTTVPECPVLPLGDINKCTTDYQELDPTLSCYEPVSRDVNQVTCGSNHSIRMLGPKISSWMTSMGFATLTCDVATGTWIGGGQVPRNQAEMEQQAGTPLTVACIDPGTTGPTNPTDPTAPTTTTAVPTTTTAVAACPVFPLGDIATCTANYQELDPTLSCYEPTSRDMSQITCNNSIRVIGPKISSWMNSLGFSTLTCDVATQTWVGGGAMPYNQAEMEQKAGTPLTVACVTPG